MEAVTIIQKMLKRENGVLLASTAVQAGLSRQRLAGLVKAGLLERTGRGVYVGAGGMGDELYTLQQKASKIVYSHESALYLHGMTDRTPFRYAITVPSIYRASAAVRASCDVYYIKPELIGLGICEVPSGMGHPVIAYYPERTVCDIIRSRNKIDQQTLIDALKNYARRKDKHLHRLFEYAGNFGVGKILYRYLEVLL